VIASRLRHSFFNRKIYSLRYLDQEVAKWPCWSSSQAATCYCQYNHSKVKAILLSALPNDTTSEFAYLSSFFTLPLFYLERQVGRLWIPTFQVFIKLLLFLCYLERRLRSDWWICVCVYYPAPSLGWKPSISI